MLWWCIGFFLIECVHKYLMSELLVFIKNWAREIAYMVGWAASSE